MKYWKVIADRLHAEGWSWVIAAPLPVMAGAILTPIAKVAATSSILTNR